MGYKPTTQHNHNSLNYNRFGILMEIQIEAHKNRGNAFWSWASAKTKSPITRFCTYPKESIKTLGSRTTTRASQIHGCAPLSHLDASTDQEIHQYTLELGLAGLEVITADEDAVKLSQLHNAGHEAVLRGAVQESTLQPTQKTKHTKQR